MGETNNIQEGQMRKCIEALLAQWPQGYNLETNLRKIPDSCPQTKTEEKSMEWGGLLRMLDPSFWKQTTDEYLVIKPKWDGSNSCHFNYNYLQDLESPFQRPVVTLFCIRIPFTIEKKKERR